MSMSYLKEDFYQPKSSGVYLVNQPKSEVSSFFFFTRLLLKMKKKRIENFVMTLNDELGEGSFGKVYKGMNETTKQVVAIKVLSKKMIDQDEYVKDALVSEIKIMRKLKSEYIVGFVDILETANNYYVVQEFCNGGDLRVTLKKTKTFPETQAIEYLEQILMGFLELIENSVIHRDMKPENIMIHNGRLKIADFGFAKNVISSKHMQKSMVGTPLYMAPQVLKREKYTSKCDIWAIGVIFFEMLFGALPWTGKSQYELVTNIMKKELAIPEKVKVNPTTADFIKGCLKQQQSKRFSWQQIYAHPIFNGHFTAFTQKNKKLSEKSGYVINKLRLQIHSQNIDMEKLFNRLKYSKATSLTKSQFFNLLKTLDNKIDDSEAQYVFEKFDSDGNGLIELEEFKQVLVDNGVRMTNKPLSLVKKQTIIEGEGVDQDEDKVIEIVIKLRQKIQAHKLDLFTVYDSYDKNKDQSLSFEEFVKLLCKIDSTLTPAEQELCFNKFDINGDKKISFDEFYRTICKIAGEPACLATSKKKK